MSAEDRERALSLIARAEGLVAIADPAEANTSLSAVRIAWAELQADTDVDSVLAGQFDTAIDAVREAVAEREQERQLEVERAAAMVREQSDRVAICEAIERLGGDGAEDQAADLKVRWDALPAMPSEYAASLTRRFQDTCRAFEARERRRRLSESAAGRLESLASEVEQLVGSEQPLDDMLSRWRGIRRDVDVLREFSDANPAAAERLERAVAQLEEKEAEQQRVRARVEQEHLKRLQQLCRQLEVLAAADTISLKAGDKALRDIKAAFEERAPLPSKKDRQDVQTRLDAARAVLAGDEAALAVARVAVAVVRGLAEYADGAGLLVPDDEPVDVAGVILAQADDGGVVDQARALLGGRARRIALRPIGRHASRNRLDPGIGPRRHEERY